MILLLLLLLLLEQFLVGERVHLHRVQWATTDSVDRGNSSGRAGTIIRVDRIRLAIGVCVCVCMFNVGVRQCSD